MSLNTIFLIVLAIWLAALSVWLFLLQRFFSHLVKGTKEADLKKTLEAILALEDKNARDLIRIDGDLRKLAEDGKFHIQKVGLVRFNPFRETGGDHSFSLVLLDGENCGVAITSLHTRERTRVYLKSIKVGKGEIALSDEEKKALAKAQGG